MATAVERVGDDLLYRIPAGGSVIYTDERGTELLRITSVGDVVKVAGKTIDPDALTALATLDDLTASAAELNYNDITTLGTVQASKAVTADASKDVTGFRDIAVRNLDAGASGTAGSLDVFAGTASKGKLAVTTTDQTGDTIVSLVIGAMAAARTITLADPLAAADILTGKMDAVARTATADGLTTGIIADAGLLQFVAVTSANAAHIVALPTPTPGRIVVLYVGANGYELKSSTPASIAINGGTGAAVSSTIAASMMAVAICTSATTWHGFTITAATLAAIEAAH